MRFLLDTHALIWWWTDRSLLPRGIDGLIESADEEIFVSSVSAWEMATKARIGKLPQIMPFLARYTAAIKDANFVSLDLNTEHGLRAGQYDAPHRDPFDRMLAAQAEVENLTLITRDPAFAAFPCKILW